MVGREKKSEFYPDQSVSVATSDDDVLGLSLSQEVYMEERFSLRPWIYSLMGQ